MTDRWRNPCRRPVGAPGDHWDEWYAHTSNTQLRILFGARHACARLRKQRDDLASKYGELIDELISAQDDAMTDLSDVIAERDAAREELHLRVSQLTEDHRTELARLRKELAEVTASKWTPGTESSPTGGGDFEEHCNFCGETVDGPHTWEACATWLVKERDRLVDSLSELPEETR